MTQPKSFPSQTRRSGALTTDQLEAGLLTMGDGAVDMAAFWDRNVTAFRQTLHCAIRDTSEALVSKTLPMRLRVQLETQLEDLTQQVELTDRYIEVRSQVRGPLSRTLGLPSLDLIDRATGEQCRSVPCDNQLLIRRKDPQSQP